jgi:hypothetical protein
MWMAGRCYSDLECADLSALFLNQPDEKESGDKRDPGRGRAGSPAEHLGWGAIRAGVLVSPHSKSNDRKLRQP